MRTQGITAVRCATRLAIACLLLTALDACSSPPQVLTKLQVERVTVPEALLTVADEPAVPESRLQSAAADYLVRLKANDDQCHADMDAVAASQK